MLVLVNKKQFENVAMLHVQMINASLELRAKVKIQDHWARPSRFPLFLHLLYFQLVYFFPRFWSSLWQCGWMNWHNTAKEIGGNNWFKFMCLSVWDKDFMVSNGLVTCSYKQAQEIVQSLNCLGRYNEQRHVHKPLSSRCFTHSLLLLWLGDLFLLYEMFFFFLFNLFIIHL